MGKLKIDPEFKSLIPPLSEEERADLEANLTAWGSAREPLVEWNGLLLDGHNRFEICERLGLHYEVTSAPFAIDTRDDAKIWIIDNQKGRRNLPPFVRIELEAARARILADRARANSAANLKRGPDVQNSGPREAAGKVDKSIATASGTSHDTVHKARVIIDRAPDPIKEAVRRQDLSIHAGYEATKVIEKLPPEKRDAVVSKIAGGAKVADAVREVKREAVRATLEDVGAREAKAAQGVYDVIVLDPPWPMEKIERDERPNQVAFDYPTMSEAELAGLNVPCAADCHVWVWTTQKFFPMAMRLLEAWQLKYVCTFVWHKPGGPQPFGLPQYNCEFAIYARRGAPQFLDTKDFFTCFEAPRGKHSEKPESFYDVVRRVTAGRRLDMFNRRSIEGFDGWGKEAADAAQ